MVWFDAVFVKRQGYWYYGLWRDKSFEVTESPNAECVIFARSRWLWLAKVKFAFAILRYILVPGGDYVQISKARR